MTQLGEVWEDEGLSAEDMATLDGIWKTSGGDPVTEGPVIGLEAPSRPEIPLAAEAAEPEEVDIEAAKALLDEQDGAGVFPWRSASREQIAGQWQELREFVEWTVLAYRLNIGSEHNPCWWRHPEIILEWTGLRHLYDLSWSEDNSGDGPNNFHYWLQATRARLVAAWKKYQQCTPREHAEPRAMTTPTVINDAEWAELTGAKEPYKLPEQWPSRIERQTDDAEDT